MLIADHLYEEVSGLGVCFRCADVRSAHPFSLPPVTLPSGPPVRSDYERTLERIQELEEMLKAPPESEAHVWKRRALDAEGQLIKNIDTIEALRQEVAGLRTQRSVLMDSERSLSIKLRMAENQVRNLQDDLYSSEEERLKAKEEAGNLQLRLDESLKREGALHQRLNNLDTLARDILARVEKMTSALDR